MNAETQEKIVNNIEEIIQSKLDSNKESVTVISDIVNKLIIKAESKIKNSEVLLVNNEIKFNSNYTIGSFTLHIEVANKTSTSINRLYVDMDCYIHWNSFHKKYTLNICDTDENNSHNITQDSLDSSLEDDIHLITKVFAYLIQKDKCHYTYNMNNGIYYICSSNDDHLTVVIDKNNR